MAKTPHRTTKAELSRDELELLEGRILPTARRWVADYGNHPFTAWKANPRILERMGPREQEAEVITANPIQEIEDAVYAALIARYRTNPEFCFAQISAIASDVEMPPEYVRIALRKLTDGLAAYAAGLFTEDGEVFGSGYAVREAL